MSGPTPEAAAPVVHLLTTCPHCGSDVPVGTYCGTCGQHLDPDKGDRNHAFAGAPHEHVAHFAVISTLFPHLPRRQAHAFRIVLGVAIALVLLLAAIRLVTPATLVSVLVLPVLYLLYLYESEVYEDDPLAVVALTFVVGGALGYLYVWIADHLVTVTFSGTQQGVFVAGVALPLIAQLLMLVGPVLLLPRRKFAEMLDGLTFGAAAGLGFAMVATITASWHIFTNPLVNGIPSDDILRLLRSGVVAAVVDAGTTGLICAAIWLEVHRSTRGSTSRRWRTALLLAIPAGFVVQIGLGVAGYYITSLLGLLILWAAVAAALLVLVRLVLHAGLLSEAVEHELGPLAACPECHQVLPTMAFCPNCGVARDAAPKHTRRRLRAEAS